jgi:hypothetical protein
MPPHRMCRALLERRSLLLIESGGDGAVAGDWEALARHAVVPNTLRPTEKILELRLAEAYIGKRPRPPVVAKGAPVRRKGAPRKHRLKLVAAVAKLAAVVGAKKG